MCTILRRPFEPHKTPGETNLGRIWSVRLAGSEPYPWAGSESYAWAGSEPYAWAGSESYVVVVNVASSPGPMSSWCTWARSRETHVVVANLALDTGRLRQAHDVGSLHQTGPGGESHLRGARWWARRADTVLPPDGQEKQPKDGHE